MAVTIAVSHARHAAARVGDRAEAAPTSCATRWSGRGEEWVIPLAGAVYQGGGHPAARSKGHGVLGLTDRRVVFLPIAGEQLSVPRVRITGVRLEERRRDAAAATPPAGHRHRLVLTLDDDTAARASSSTTPARWEQALAASGSSGGRGDLKG